MLEVVTLCVLREAEQTDGQAAGVVEKAVVHLNYRHRALQHSHLLCKKLNMLSIFITTQGGL